jgi:predicted acylesterase/phospholipase RssA
MRSVLTDAQLQERTAAERVNQEETFRTCSKDLVDRIWKEYQSADPASPPTIDILALSGGGDYGAFGAGFLVGWGKLADPAWRRPNFDIVTGVSTGALLAPFAYVDTDEACLSVETFYRNPKADWVEQRGWPSFLPSNPSFMIIPKLEKALETAVPPSLVNQMAEQSRQGKQLLVSATDLDYGRQHFWSLGPEAEAAATSGNSDRLRRILLASAAIPVAFPPVEIDGSLYADGGVTANVFVRLDPKDPVSFAAVWMQSHPKTPLPRVRYWVIINNSLAQPPATVQAKWPEVLGPSLATSIRSATVAQVRWLTAQSDYVNATLNTDIQVRVVAIPDEWRPPVKGAFQKETMNSLADLGRKLGADPASWTLWSSPRQPGK